MTNNTNDQNKINTSAESFNTFIDSSGFSSLNDELKSKAIDSFERQQGVSNNNKTGLLGKILGNYTENISLYIAFIVLILLILIGLIYIFIPLGYKQDSNIEFWQLIGPIITGTLGYIFGSNHKK